MVKPYAMTFWQNTIFTKRTKFYEPKDKIKNKDKKGGKQKIKGRI